MKKSLYISLVGIVGLSLAGCVSNVSTATKEEVPLNCKLIY